MGVALVTLPDGKKARITFDSQEQLDATIDDLTSAKPAAAPEKPDASAMERTNAAASGVNKGVANLLGLPMDTAVKATNIVKAGIEAGYLATGNVPPTSLDPSTDNSGTPLTSDWLKAHMGTTVVNPRPDDRASRLLHAGGEGVSTAAVAAATGAPMIPAVLSGVAGSEASQVTAELGGGPLAQTAAGLISAATPSGLRVGVQGALRAAARGGEAGRLQTAQNAQDFANAGTDATVGQATGSRTMQATESLLSKLPGSAGVMDSKAAAEQAQIGANVEGKAATLSPAASPEAAGRAINSGISGSGGFVESFKAKANQLYGNLDQYIPPDTPVSVGQTDAALKGLTTPIKGAEETSSTLINSRIAKIADAFKADSTANNGTIPYDALKRLRTMVGQELADAPLKGDVPTAQWKQLYGALSADMEGAAKASGAQAEAAFNRANTFYKAGSERIQLLEQVVGKNGGPEKVFAAATDGTKQGATVIRSVMRSLPDDAQKSVSATVLRRLGTPVAGQQTEATTFSTNTFLTNWNKMDAGAKSALFDRYSPTFRSDLDDVAKAAGNIREGSKVFSNPSRTSHGAAQVTAAGAFFYALGSGELKTAAAVASGVGAANLSARIMTNPNAVKFLARTTRASASAVPALVNQIAQSPDPDLHELGQLMQTDQ